MGRGLQPNLLWLWNSQQGRAIKCAFHTHAACFSLLFPTNHRRGRASHKGWDKEATHPTRHIYARSGQSKPMWVCSLVGTSLKWAKQRHQIWPNQGPELSIKQAKRRASVSDRKPGGRKLRAWEGRYQIPRCSEGYGCEGQLPLDPVLPLGRVNPWIRVFRRFEGWGTENIQAGRGKLQWETQVDSRLKKKPNAMEASEKLLSSPPIYPEGRRDFSFPNCSWIWAVPTYWSYTNQVRNCYVLGWLGFFVFCGVFLISAVTSHHLNLQSPRQPEQRATNPKTRWHQTTSWDTGKCFSWDYEGKLGSDTEWL